MTRALYGGSPRKSRIGMSVTGRLFGPQAAFQRARLPDPARYCERELGKLVAFQMKKHSQDFIETA
jgi:hypothetical protein